MKQLNDQTNYETPQITVLDVIIEKGFASSLDGLGDGPDFTNNQGWN